MPNLTRRTALASLIAALATRPLAASPARDDLARELLDRWLRLTLELVRHTATMSPPIASRAFAVLSVIAYEAGRAGGLPMQSMAGQLPDLAALPEPPGTDLAATLEAALSLGIATLFSNTGPTGQRALAAATRKLSARAAEGLPDASAPRAAGEAVARHVLAWAETDGAGKIENMGFPITWTLGTAEGHWVPTSAIVQQQAPLLPKWGEQRPFALGPVLCELPPPPAYSRDKTSPFFAEAMEVYETSRALTPEQKLIARFWSDDPMLSPTPPGHWIVILCNELKARPRPLPDTLDALLRLSVSMADAFIACWREKMRYDLLRPVSYIRAEIDPAWQPLLITPPFPEYPSGHSTQSGAAATVLTALFGEDYAFTDSTHVDEGLPERRFPSFWAAAEEAAMSRLYGGIHYRAACEQGLAQGRCVGAQALKLRTL